jgi:GT2 family glycosyltransferase
MNTQSRSSGEISLSVALVTCNRPDSLERTLKSLRAQSVRPREVVISDDSDGEHVQDVQRLAGIYDCRYVGAAAGAT